MSDFDKDYKLVNCGPGLWQAINRYTNESASPRYTDKAAAKYYVERELKQQMEDAVHELLGGDTSEYIRSES